MAIDALAVADELGIDDAEIRMLLPASKWPFHGDTHRVWARGGEFVFARVSDVGVL
jgi:hypothetical protein